MTCLNIMEKSTLKNKLVENIHKFKIDEFFGKYTTDKKLIYRALSTR